MWHVPDSQDVASSGTTVVGTSATLTGVKGPHIYSQDWDRGIINKYSFCFCEKFKEDIVAMSTSHFNHTNLIIKIIFFTCVYLFIFLSKKCFSSAQQNVEV